jgi:serine protease Do
LSGWRAPALLKGTKMAIDTETMDSAEVELTNGAAPISDAIIALVEKARHSVVEVRGRGRGAGAGIIWGTDGKIVTNFHVVEGTGGKPQVQLYDGTRLTSTVVAENPALDLALLQVDSSNLPALPIGDSAKLRIGELVFAFGHPWGHKDVVTAGIVSGVGKVRGGRGERSAEYVRSDVRLAPGNSGGPLVNVRGEVVGVNSMIFGGDLSIAVPSSVVVDWLSRAGNRVYLGVGVRPVRINPAREEEQTVSGVLVIQLDASGPASKAGIKVGDIVLAVAGQQVANTAMLKRALVQGVAEGKVELALVRNGKLLKLEVEIAQAA